MIRAACLLLACLLAAAGADPSRIRDYSLEITMDGDTLVRHLSVTALAGDDGRFLRNRFDFDPEYQSVNLLEVFYGFPGGTVMEPPDWAVDTLTGGNGYPLSLAVAMPGLLQGMEVSYSLETRDWSPWYSGGPWLLFDPAGLPCIERFSASFADPDGTIRHLGNGYRSPGGGRGEFLVESELPSGRLWVASTDSWTDLGETMLRRADSVISAPVPPDLRGAVIEAAAAGADPMMAAERARTLLTESFAVMDNPPGWRVFSVSPVQEILDSRTATPLEMAVLMRIIGEELGLEAEILPASLSRPGLPVPAGWERFLVRLTGEGGRSMLVEPSARLVQTGYIHADDTLYALAAGEGRILGIPPPGEMQNMCRETWTLDPAAGTFSLSLDCRGVFDMILRRRLAGLTGSELPAALSAWIWRTGVVMVPDTVEVSDFYDLSTPASLRAHGRLLSGQVAGLFYTRAPRMLWEVPDGVGTDLTVSWILPGADCHASSPELEVEQDDSVTRVTDAGGGPDTFLMMVESR
jgi:hypothetical protein